MNYGSFLKLQGNSNTRSSKIQVSLVYKKQIVGNLDSFQVFLIARH